MHVDVQYEDGKSNRMGEEGGGDREKGDAYFVHLHTFAKECICTERYVHMHSNASILA